MENCACEGGVIDDVECRFITKEVAEKSEFKPFDKVEQKSGDDERKDYCNEDNPADGGRSFETCSAVDFVVKPGDEF